jgi:hypothetical protein
LSSEAEGDAHARQAPDRSGLATLLVPLAAFPAESTVLFFGLPPTITAEPGAVTYGTAGDDVIVGTDGVDYIYGRGGRDRICGLGGNDHLYGGAGRDRISGGAGDDFIRGDGGIRNILVGGPGADVIYADGDRDLVSGNGGADYISTYGADYSAARGGPGNDTIFTGDWTKLDAGSGRDHCGLSTGVVAANCETIRLFCGLGGADLPDLGSLAGLTSAPGNFDGDEDADTLYMWHDDTLGWIMHVELDNGYGAQHVFGQPAESLAALGGYDINDDGIDEIFAQAGSNPRPVVGIGTLYLPLSTPTSTCIIEGPEFGLGGDPLFAIGASTSPGQPDNGLACRPTDHTLRLFVQTPWDADTFLQSRYDLAYEPRLGVGRPKFVDAADTHLLFDTPADDDAIQRAREFHCPGMALP